jgi:hypothetical protein
MMQLGDTLMAIEGPIRLSVFAVMLIALVTWELTAPRRRQDIPRVLRWTNNIAFVVFDTLILRLGIELFRTPRDQWLDRMLVQPFRNGQGRGPDDKA